MACLLVQVQLLGASCRGQCRALAMTSSWPEDAHSANRAPILSGGGRRVSRASFLGGAATRAPERERERESVDVRGRKKREAGPRRIMGAAVREHRSMGLLGACTKAVVAAAGTILIGIAAIGFSLAFQPTWLVRWMQRQRQDILFLKPTTDLVVALTIDDGPHEDITPELLDILKENQSNATFFIIGHNMDHCPTLVERIHREGHEVGNHTMFDEPSWRLSMTDFEQQLVAVDNRLNRFYFHDSDGNPIKWFRPGYGFFTNPMLERAKSHGYRTALGSLFPFDNVFTSQGNLIAQYLLWRVHPGAVIVLHDRSPQKQQTAQVLRKLLPGLRRRGYSVRSISELLNLRPSSQ